MLGSHRNPSCGRTALGRAVVVLLLLLLLRDLTLCSNDRSALHGHLGQLGLWGIACARLASSVVPGLRSFTAYMFNLLVT